MTAVWIYCVVCERAKKPLGRSAPMEMCGSLCDDECRGYRSDPQPDCRWPGEESCGPGCTRGQPAPASREGDPRP